MAKSLNKNKELSKNQKSCLKLILSTYLSFFIANWLCSFACTTKMTEVLYCLALAIMFISSKYKSYIIEKARISEGLQYAKEQPLHTKDSNLTLIAAVLALLPASFISFIEGETTTTVIAILLTLKVISAFVIPILPCLAYIDVFNQDVTIAVFDLEGNGQIDTLTKHSTKKWDETTRTSPLYKNIPGNIWR